MAQDQQYRVVVVGLGHQGTGIVSLLIEHGHDVVGAVDIGDKVGRPIGEVVGDDRAPDTPVSGSLAEVLDQHEDADVVVLAASNSGEETAELAREAIGRGIDVITLHQDLFNPGDWTAGLDSFAKEHGGSFLSTGIQDTWWVQLPALAAASSTNIKRISIESNINLETVSEVVCRMAGIGLPAPEEFYAHIAKAEAMASAVAGPLLELARRMGATPSAPEHGLNPVTREEDYAWHMTAETIPAGNAAGIEELFSFDTEEGIHFEAAFRVLPLGVDGKTHDVVRIEGDPDVTVTYDPFMGEPITNVALLHRIPDLVAAEPGVHFAATLPAPGYHFPSAAAGS